MRITETIFKKHIILLNSLRKYFRAYKRMLPKAKKQVKLSQVTKYQVPRRRSKFRGLFKCKHGCSNQMLQN